MFFAVALLFSSIIPNYLAPLVSMPLLIPIDRTLKKAAPIVNFNHHIHRRTPTHTSIAIGSIAIAILILSIIVSDLTLLLASAVMIVYLILTGVFVIRRFTLKPIREEQIRLRIIAGKKEDVKFKINPVSRIGGIFFFESEYDWIKIKTQTIYLKSSAAFLQISITPPLSGPSVIKLKGYAVDQWGLMETSFEIEPVRLLVIPRARYADWLARKYMAGTKPGSLPLLSNTGITKMLQGLRQGVEYYGNRTYQVGDSLKNINWKASSKYRELISKEFIEFRGQPAVLLVNLVTADAEQLDKQAYNILVTAISLGQENIPAAVAVYDREKVVMTTPMLSPFQLVSHSLQIVKQLVILTSPVKYLSPPDVSRLRSNIHRLSLIDSRSAKKLAELLDLEYKALSTEASRNPCTLALLRIRAKLSGQFSVVVLSQHNHDAEALAVNSYMITRKGGTVIDI
jgi:hypothetical protein